MHPEQQLARLGLELPEPIKLPPTLQLPFSFVNLRGDRALISGHPKQNSDGSIGGPFGQVGRDLTTEEAQLAARDIGLSILANLKAEIGELSRVAGWLRVFGMINSAPDYDQQHIVMNGFSDLLMEVFGSEIGRHSRSAVGVSGLPMNFAIEIEAEVLLAPACVQTGVGGRCGAACAFCPRTACRKLRPLSCSPPTARLFAGEPAPSEALTETRRPIFVVFFAADGQWPC